MKRYPFLGEGSTGKGKYNAEISLIKEFGPSIGLSEEFVKGTFRYRLKENPSAKGVWIPYEKAVELAKKAAEETKNTIEERLIFLTN